MKSFLRKIPLLAVIAGIIGFMWYGFQPVPIRVDVVKVQRGSFDITINDDGETRIREKYIVSSPVAGKLLRIELHAGDTVERGETVLARIEPRDPSLLDARSQAEAEARVRTAEAALKLAESGRGKADAALSLAKHDFDRAYSLRKKQAMSQGDFDAIDHKKQMAEADLRSADFAIHVAKFESELAKAALVRSRQPSGTVDSPAQMTIVSPIGGRVLTVFNEDAGVVTPGTRILELGDPGDMEMKIDVLSTEAVRIKPGAKILVEHWGGDTVLDGIVRIIEPSAFLKVSALGVEEKRVNVIADFIGPFECRRSLGDGFRIEAAIVIDSVENVVTVPAGVLFRQADKWHAYKAIDGVAKLQPVTIGKQNGQLTEVIDGLNPGDRVILHPTDKVKDGVGVEVPD